MAEFPSASTTGVRDGVTLTPSGGITINTAGAVVSGLNITGDVVITAPNVTLVDCRVTGSIIVKSTGATIEYVDAVGRSSLNTIDINPNGRAGEGENTTIRFCDISGSENGIWLEADGCLIEDNYIHNLFSNTGASDPHIDGIQIPGSNIGAAPTENAIIRHNNIDLDNRTASASITMMDGINIDIIDNRLNGGSAVIYFEGASRDCDVVNNVFDEYAYWYISGASWRDQAYSGNVDEVTGSLLPFNDDPAAPAITSFSSDSGTAGDRITNDKTLALVGTAAANSTVTVFDGSTQIGTATANSSGAWSVTTAALADGSHPLTATATNSGGTSSTSAPFSVTIDTVAPSAPTIAASTSAATLASTRVEVLTGTAEAGSTVAVFDGTTKLGTAVANSSGAWSYTTAALATGSHSFTATATDVAGNTGAASSAASVTIAAANSIEGTGGNDVLTGDGSDNIILGYAGNDTLTGLGGNDKLDGGTGADRMEGGTGNDTYVVDNAGDAVHELAGGGTDQVLASVNYTLAAGSEIELLTTTNAAGTGAINLTGNAFAQIMHGNAGNNVLNGADGNDTLNGGSGNDTLNGGAGNDTLAGNSGRDTFLFDTALSAATNVDRITDYHSRSDTIQLENAVFTALTSTGTLARSAFHVGAAAHDGTDRIIYNPATGALTYDSNGDAAGGATQFATLDTGLSLSKGDFVVV